MTRRPDRLIAAVLMVSMFFVQSEAFASIIRPSTTPDVWRVRVTGGIPVTVIVHGGGANLGLFIYNPDGRRVGDESDVNEVDVDHSRIATWVPIFSGIAVIRIVNRVGDYQIGVVGGELLNGVSPWGDSFMHE